MKRNWIDKKVLILGLSKSGVSAARYLNAQGASCYVSEINPPKEADLNLIGELEIIGIRVETQQHSEEFIDDAYLAVVSPGIPPSAEIFTRLKAKNIPVISEIELAYLESKTPFIAITGTNGKTTTTEFISHVLSTEFSAPACGNIGLPPTSLLNGKHDFLVCEVSSYQLHFSPTFRPQFALWLNFTPDHLSWHAGLENYFDAKAGLFAEHKLPGFAVFNATDERVFEFSKRYAGGAYYFGKDLGEVSCYTRDGVMHYRSRSDEERVIELGEVGLVGEHNYQNIEAGVIVAKIVGVSDENIEKAVKSFKAPEHRCEFVGKLGGIEFYNDSKATNPEASIFAIRSFAGKSVTLIAGGRDKNTPLDEFCEVVKSGVANVILIGEAKERFRLGLESCGFTNVSEAESLEQAIDRSIEISNDVTLLSPACASFDMYENFEQRGIAFKNYVLSRL